MLHAAETQGFGEEGNLSSKVTPDEADLRNMDEPSFDKSIDQMKREADFLSWIWLLQSLAA